MAPVAIKVVDAPLQIFKVPENEPGAVEAVFTVTTAVLVSCTLHPEVGLVANTLYVFVTAGLTAEKFIELPVPETGEPAAVVPILKV